MHPKSMGTEALLFGNLPHIFLWTASSSQKYFFKKSELKNTIMKMKNTLEETNSILDNSEEKTSDLEDKLVEFTQLEQQKEKRKN